MAGRHNKAKVSTPTEDRRPQLTIYFDDPALYERFRVSAQANRRTMTAHALTLIEAGLSECEPKEVTD